MLLLRLVLLGQESYDISELANRLANQEDDDDEDDVEDDDDDAKSGEESPPEKLRRTEPNPEEINIDDLDDEEDSNKTEVESYEPGGVSIPEYNPNPYLSSGLGAEYDPETIVPDSATGYVPEAVAAESNEIEYNPLSIDASVTNSYSPMPIVVENPEKIDIGNLDSGEENDDEESSPVLESHAKHKPVSISGSGAEYVPEAVIPDSGLEYVPEAITIELGGIEYNPNPVDVFDANAYNPMPLEVENPVKIDIDNLNDEEGDGDGSGSPLLESHTEYEPGKVDLELTYTPKLVEEDGEKVDLKFSKEEENR